MLESVPLKKHEAVFLAKAYASTIHKVQGLTLDKIVVDMKGTRFSPGQAYRISSNRMHSLYLFQCFDIACTIQGRFVFEGALYFLPVKSYPEISLN